MQTFPMGNNGKAGGSVSNGNVFSARLNGFMGASMARTITRSGVLLPHALPVVSNKSSDVGVVVQPEL